MKMLLFLASFATLAATGWFGSDTSDASASASYSKLGFDDIDLLRHSWAEYKQQYGKIYETQDIESVRFENFANNWRMIRSHNLHAETSESVTFTLGLNKYSDLSDKERAYMNGFKRPANAPREGSMYLSPSFVYIPDSVDWRTKGYVTPVKDQGACGSCWAFSATGSLEGQHFRATGRLVSLSEQNLVDCSTDYGNFGCNGGYMDNAFRCVRLEGGIDTESGYPYTAEDDPCNFRKSDIGATDTGFVDLPTEDEEKLKEAVATIGPISVAIDAGNPSFSSYSSGIYNEPDCKSKYLDHAVLVVGYGIDGGQDYWLVKNSWGESWGMNGYIKMSRNKNNQCGIATNASYPLV